MPVTCKGKDVRIIPEAAASYHQIGCYLLNDDTGAIVEGLEKTKQSDTLRDIFGKWLREDRERSWGKLIDCLKYCDLGSLAEDVETALNLQPQPHMPLM